MQSLKKQFIHWLSIIFLVVLPGIPASKYLYSYFNIELIGRGFKLYLLLWLMLAAVNISIRWYRYRYIDKWNINPIYFTFIFLSCTPALFVGIWFFSAPVSIGNIYRIFAASCLLPLFINLLWEIVLNKFTWAELILPVVSILITAMLFEVTSGFFLVTNLTHRGKYVNSPDSSYYYYDKIIDEDGINVINSFGFLGPEPDMDHSRIKILLIGDSIPIIIGKSISYARSPANFPNVATDLYNRETRLKEQIEIMNASITAYSLEQIKRFYIEKLKELPHDLLIISFFIDDITRELRYRKNHFLYNPMWPEWMQNTYYNCMLCRLILNVFDFTDNTFQTAGYKSYEKYFPTALKILNEIRNSAETRGVKIAVINLPLLKAMSDRWEYKHMEMNHMLEDWCTKMKIPYHDVLPCLIGQDMKRLTVDGMHFTKLGHEIVGADLKDFIKSIISSNYLQTNRGN